jgi:hypothetical protein
MGKPILMHVMKASQYLICQMLGHRNRYRTMFGEVMMKIAMAAMLHGNEN